MDHSASAKPEALNILVAFRRSLCRAGGVNKRRAWPFTWRLTLSRGVFSWTLDFDDFFVVLMIFFLAADTLALLVGLGLGAVLFALG